MATEVVNVPDLDLQFFGNDGKPMASGHVVFFRNGTDIPESVYTSDGETALGNTIELDASGFPVVQFSLIADKKYTVKLFNADNVLVWTRNDIQGTICGGPGPIGDFIPMDGTTPADPVRGPLIMSYDGKTAILNGEYLSLTSGGKTTTLTTEYLSNDSAMQMVAPTVTMGANDGGAYVYGTPRVSINANGPDSAVINIQSDKKVGMYGSQIEIKAPNSGNEITINSKGITEIIGGITSVQGNNGLSLYGGGTGITINGAANFLSTATLNGKTINDIWTSSSTGVPSDSQLITAKAALESAGGSVTTSGGVQGDGTALDPVTLKLDSTGNVTLTQGVDGLKAVYSADDEAAEYYSYPFTMTTHLLSRPAEMMIVPVHVDWPSNIRSVKFYNGTLGGASTPYTVILYHSVGDINTPGSYLEPFGYYYKSDSASDIVKGWNIKPLTFRGENNTWDETEYLATNGEEIFVGFWSRDSVGVPYIEGYADKAMGCEYTAWGSIPTLATVKTDIQVSNIYALASHIHIVLSSEEAP